MTHLVRLDDPVIRIVGTSETVIVMYPIKSVPDDEGGWTWEYTGGDSKIYDECSEVREDPETKQLIFQDENGADVLFSNVGVLLDPVTMSVMPLRAEG